MSTFACQLEDGDLVRGMAPPQPTIEVGQRWLRCEDGAELPVKAVRAGIIDLGGASYTLIMSAKALRADWICVDPPAATELR